MDAYRIFPMLLVFMVCALTTLAYLLQRIGQTEAQSGLRTCASCGQMYGPGESACLRCSADKTTTEVQSDVRDRFHERASRGIMLLMERSVLTPVPSDEEANAQPTVLAGMPHAQRQ